MGKGKRVRKDEEGRRGSEGGNNKQGREYCTFSIHDLTGRVHVQRHHHTLQAFVHTHKLASKNNWMARTNPSIQNCSH